MDKILKSRMLSYYENQIAPCANNNLSSAYSGNIVNLNNIQEYTSQGNRNNYSPQFSYFRPN